MLKRCIRVFFGIISLSFVLISFLNPSVSVFTVKDFDKYFLADQVSPTTGLLSIQSKELENLFYLKNTADRKNPFHKEKNNVSYLIDKFFSLLSETREFVPSNATSSIIKYIDNAPEFVGVLISFIENNWEDFNSSEPFKPGEKDKLINRFVTDIFDKIYTKKRMEVLENKFNTTYLEIKKRLDELSKSSKQRTVSEAVAAKIKNKRKIVDEIKEIDKKIEKLLPKPKKGKKSQKPQESELVIPAEKQEEYKKLVLQKKELVTILDEQINKEKQEAQQKTPEKEREKLNNQITETIGHVGISKEIKDFHLKLINDLQATNDMLNSKTKLSEQERKKYEDRKQEISANLVALKQMTGLEFHVIKEQLQPSEKIQIEAEKRIQSLIEDEEKIKKSIETGLKGICGAIVSFYASHRNENIPIQEGVSAEKKTETKTQKKKKVKELEVVSENETEKKKGENKPLVDICFDKHVIHRILLGWLWLKSHAINMEVDLFSEKKFFLDYLQVLAKHLKKETQLIITKKESIEKAESIEKKETKDIKPITSLISYPEDIFTPTSEAFKSFIKTPVITDGDAKQLNNKYNRAVVTDFKYPEYLLYFLKNIYSSNYPQEFLFSSGTAVKKISGSSTFSDCTETAMRLFINMIIFNPQNKTFDWTILEKLGAIDELVSFYKKYTREEGLTSKETFNAWASICSDLTNILYCKFGRYELEAGLINTSNLIAYFFKIDQKTPQKIFDALKEKLKTQNIDLTHNIKLNIEGAIPLKDDLDSFKLSLKRDDYTREGIWKFTHGHTIFSYMQEQKKITLNDAFIKNYILDNKIETESKIIYYPFVYNEETFNEATKSIFTQFAAEHKFIGPLTQLLSSDEKKRILCSTYWKEDTENQLNNLFMKQILFSMRKDSSQINTYTTIAKDRPKLAEYIFELFQLHDKGDDFFCNMINEIIKKSQKISYKKIPDIIKVLSPLRIETLKFVTQLSIKVFEDAKSVIPVLTELTKYLPTITDKINEVISKITIDQPIHKHNNILSQHIQACTQYKEPASELPTYLSALTKAAQELTQKISTFCTKIPTSITTQQELDSAISFALELTKSEPENDILKKATQDGFKIIFDKLLTIQNLTTLVDKQEFTLLLALSNQLVGNKIYTSILPAYLDFIVPILYATYNKIVPPQELLSKITALVKNIQLNDNTVSSFITIFDYVDKLSQSIVMQQNPQYISNLLSFINVALVKKTYNEEEESAAQVIREREALILGEQTPAPAPIPYTIVSQEQANTYFSKLAAFIRNISTNVSPDLIFKTPIIFKKLVTVINNIPSINELKDEKLEDLFIPIISDIIEKSKKQNLTSVIDSLIILAKENKNVTTFTSLKLTDYLISVTSKEYSDTLPAGQNKDLLIYVLQHVQTLVSNPEANKNTIPTLLNQVTNLIEYSSDTYFEVITNLIKNIVSTTSLGILPQDMINYLSQNDPVRLVILASATAQTTPFIVSSEYKEYTQKLFETIQSISFEKLIVDEPLIFASFIKLARHVNLEENNAKAILTSIMNGVGQVIKNNSEKLSQNILDPDLIRQKAIASRYPLLSDLADTTMFNVIVNLIAAASKYKLAISPLLQYLASITHDEKIGKQDSKYLSILLTYFLSELEQLVNKKADQTIIKPFLNSIGTVIKYCATDSNYKKLFEVMHTLLSQDALSYNSLIEKIIDSFCTEGIGWENSIDSLSPALFSCLNDMLAIDSLKKSCIQLVHNVLDTYAASKKSLGSSDIQSFTTLLQNMISANYDTTLIDKVFTTMKQLIKNNEDLLNILERGGFFYALSQKKDQKNFELFAKRISLTYENKKWSFEDLRQLVQHILTTIEQEKNNNNFSIIVNELIKIFVDNITLEAIDSQTNIIFDKKIFGENNKHLKIMENYILNTQNQFAKQYLPVVIAFALKDDMPDMWKNYIDNLAERTNYSATKPEVFMLAHFIKWIVEKKASTNAEALIKTIKDYSTKIIAVCNQNTKVFANDPLFADILMSTVPKIIPIISIQQQPLAFQLVPLLKLLNISRIEYNEKSKQMIFKIIAYLYKKPEEMSLFLKAIKQSSVISDFIVQVTSAYFSGFEVANTLAPSAKVALIELSPKNPAVLQEILSLAFHNIKVKDQLIETHLLQATKQLPSPDTLLQGIITFINVQTNNNIRDNAKKILFGALHPQAKIILTTCTNQTITALAKSTYLAEVKIVAFIINAIIANKELIETYLQELVYNKNAFESLADLLSGQDSKVDPKALREVMSTKGIISTEFLSYVLFYTPKEKEHKNMLKDTIEKILESIHNTNKDSFNKLIAGLNDPAYKQLLDLIKNNTTLHEKVSSVSPPTD